MRNHNVEGRRLERRGRLNFASYASASVWSAIVGVGAGDGRVQAELEMDTAETIATFGDIKTRHLKEETKESLILAVRDVRDLPYIEITSKCLILVQEPNVPADALTRPLLARNRSGWSLFTSLTPYV